MLARSLIASLAICLCTLASAQSAVIKYKFHKGESHRFNMDMSMKMNVANQAQAMIMDTNGVFLQTVKSVAPDGTGTIALTTEKMSTEMNGRSSSQNTGSTTIVKVAPNGLTTIVSGDATQALGNMQMMSNFPKSPVRAGSTWQSNFNLPGAATGAAVGFKLTNRVDKIAFSGGQKLAFVHSFGDLDMGKLLQQMGSSKMPKGAKETGNMSADLHYIFNISAGTVQSMDGSAKFETNFSGMGSQSSSMAGAIRMAFRLLN